MTFIICDRHREDARHLPGVQRRRAESDVRALRRYRANDEHVRGVYLVHDDGPSHTAAATDDYLSSLWDW